MFSRPYLAIIDAAGEFRYFTDELADYKKYIIDFTTNNFNLLDVGDHSIPLGGIDLAFFKPEDNFLIIIHTKVGPIGQLLLFKNFMDRYAQRIKLLIGDVKSQSKIKIHTLEKVEEKKPEPEQKGTGNIQLMPVTVKKFTGSEKFKLSTSEVLQLCDGSNSIEQICIKTSMPKLKVDGIIKDLEKKGYIKLKRVIA